MGTITATPIKMSRLEPDDADAGRNAVADANLRDVATIVGTNLRRLRKAQGFSLERLAELSGVSRAMLGQIETAKSVPTVSLLWRVADALGVPVATLVATEHEPIAVVSSRARAGVLVTSEGRYSSRNLLPGNSPRAAGFFELQIAGGHREEFAPSPAGTRHNLVVAVGTLTVVIGTEAPIGLAEGDAITFEASRDYIIENSGSIDAIGYLVVLNPTA